MKYSISSVAANWHYCARCLVFWRYWFLMMSNWRESDNLPALLIFIRFGLWGQNGICRIGSFFLKRLRGWFNAKKSTIALIFNRRFFVCNGGAWTCDLGDASSPSYESRSEVSSLALAIGHTDRLLFLVLFRPAFGLGRCCFLPNGLGYSKSLRYVGAAICYFLATILSFSKWRINGLRTNIGLWNGDNTDVFCALLFSVFGHSLNNLSAFSFSGLYSLWGCPRSSFHTSVYCPLIVLLTHSKAAC